MQVFITPHAVKRMEERLKATNHKSLIRDILHYGTLIFRSKDHSSIMIQDKKGVCYSFLLQKKDKYRSTFDLILLTVIDTLPEKMQEKIDKEGFRLLKFHSPYRYEPINVIVSNNRGE